MDIRDRSDVSTRMGRMGRRRGDGMDSGDGSSTRRDREHKSMGEL